MTTIRRLFSKVFNREAALFIGAIASAVLFFVEQISGPGIFVEDTGQTLLNILPILIPAIGGAVTRFQVYSKQSVSEITDTPISALPSPP